MALPAPAANNTKRVKVYELKNNDWYDRGTGFCAGTLLAAPNSNQDQPDARIVVVSEEDPNRTLLETPITKDDGYQKQQETLIVWTESNGVDMALSFQEPDGCAMIWDFVNHVQTRLAALAPDDGLSDDLLDPGHPVHLPDPVLGKLDEIENAIRTASSTAPGRDALIKFIMTPEHMYITKLTPLVEAAEQIHSLGDLHKLCLIMKHLILLNDTSVIEFVVTDQAIMGVVGALEYDPDFPSHRANHRQYLSDSSKFKEVVQIDSPDVKRKIHYTYRLLYLKDVVLARFLDDPTFSVLNSLIFFHQVDIVNYLQSNHDFLVELFDITKSDASALRKKEAVLFIQNCCAISKSIQAQNRAQLYHNFITNGLFDVITFALRHRDASLRVAGTDILVALIDHDPYLVRNHIFTAVKERRKPLTDTLIELLLIEVDLGVKSQMADAIKILLDPNANQPMDMAARGQNGEMLAKGRLAGGQHPMAPHTEAFIASFYEDSALKLFEPLKALQHRESMLGMGPQEIGLYIHLVEVLSFFLRSHSYKGKLFIINEGLHARVAQLLGCPQKYMKLTALKWFRSCIGLKDENHNREIIAHNLLEPVLNILYETMPRDNLLNSACLELFEFISREKDKLLKGYLVDKHRMQFMNITYVETFQNLVYSYDRVEDDSHIEDSIATEDMPPRTINGQHYTGLRDDLDEEAYFDADDDVSGVDDDEIVLPVSKLNGIHAARPLVDYPDDDEDEAIELLASSPDVYTQKKIDHNGVIDQAESGTIESSPPTSIERGRDRQAVAIEGSPGRQASVETTASKRRRADDDEEDELGKLMGGQVKRRTSSASMRSRMGHTSLRESSPEAYSVNGDHHQFVHHPTEDEDSDSSPPAEDLPLGHSLRRMKSMKTRNDAQLNGKAVKLAQDTALRSERIGEDADTDHAAGG